jgi:hypothetical protein
MVAYAARHGKQKISHGSVRRRVALHRSTPSRAGRTGAPQAPRLTGDPRRRLLRPKERLPMAATAQGLPALEDRLRLVQEVAHRWDVGAPEHRAARVRERLRSQVGRDPHPSAGIAEMGLCPFARLSVPKSNHNILRRCRDAESYK